MKKRNVKNIILLSSIFFYFFLFIFFIKNNLLKYSETITASFMLLTSFFTYLSYGWPKDKKTIKKQKVFEVTLINIILYFFFTYIIGIFLGFLKNGYSLNISSIINNVLAPIIVVICSEIMRYIFVFVNKDKKFYIVILTLVLTLIEYTIIINVLKFYTTMDIFKTTATYIIPIACKHATLSYLSYNVGYKPSMAYRIIFDLSTYVLPFVPNLGSYLTIIANVSLPFATYFTTSNIINYYDNTLQKDFSINTSKILSSFLFSLLLIFAILVSGISPIKLIGVASNSMTPVYNKGDCVISIAVKEEKLEIGDVIVFNKNGKKIIHRIDNIIESENGKKYQTKGDANNSVDIGTISYEAIDGEVKFYIPYLAYPAIYLNELLNNE